MGFVRARRCVATGPVAFIPQRGAVVLFLLLLVLGVAKRERSEDLDLVVLVVMLVAAVFVRGERRGARMFMTAPCDV